MAGPCCDLASSEAISATQVQAATGTVPISEKELDVGFRI